jgi:transcription initiation factor TFIIIB Brf1 subunit/transcription initiation factor TFIIB
VSYQPLTYLRTRILMLARGADTARHLDTLARLHRISIETREESEDFRTTADNLGIDLDPANPFRFIASGLSSQADVVEAIDVSITRMEQLALRYSALLLAVFTAGVMFGLFIFWFVSRI